MRSLWRTVVRERAVIAGVLIAIAQAFLAGGLTRETAVPVVGGIVLRFLVSPHSALAALSDYEQVARVEQTDNRGPTEAPLSQDPGKVYE